MRNSSNSSGPLPVPYSLETGVAPPHTYYYPDYAEPESEGPDLKRLRLLLWRRKWWLCGAALLGLGVGWVFSRTFEPEYSTSTALSIESGGGNTRSGPIQTGQVFGVDAWTDVFASRAVLSPVVDSLGLQLRFPHDADRSLFETFRTGSESAPGDYTLDILPGRRWALRRAGLDAPVEQGAFGATIGSSSGFTWTPDLSRHADDENVLFQVLSHQNAVRGLASHLTVNVQNRANIIRATLTWHDPVQAASILNALAARFIELADQLKTTKIREEVELLRQQADLTGELLANAEYNLQNQRVEAITEPTEPLVTPSEGPGSTGQDPIFATFAQNKIRSDQLKLELSRIGDLQASIQRGEPVNVLALQNLPSAGKSTELQAALTALEQARLNRRALLSTYTEEAPEVIAVARQIQELESAVVPQALAQLARELQAEVSLVDTQIASQGQQLRAVPRRTIQTARLQREVAQAATLHGTLLGRLKEAELAQATSGPGITILDQAWPNPTPSGEKPSRVMLIFTLLSLGIGVAGVIVLDRFDDRIHSPDQVTGTLGLPVLAVVPRLQATPDPTSPAAAIAVESFRGLRTQIAHANGTQNGITLITSPAPREGKSMVSANLAISYATAGYRTILMDADTRRGRAQEMFNLKRSPGLTDYLMERATLEDVLQKTTVENLTLLARGAPGGFNADLLESQRMQDLIGTLRADYDMVVMDGPPLAAGADVMLLGSLVDKVVIVLRAGTTTEDLARAKLETLGNVDLPIVGAVLNALPKSAPEYEYYVHYYYADAES